jgi:hypothetical protein
VDVTYNGSGINTGLTAYVNGILEPTTPTFSGSYVAMSNRTDTLKVGSGIYPTAGKIDDFQLYSYERTSNQVYTSTTGSVHYVAP